jgi:hypothetical protein
LDKAIILFDVIFDDVWRVAAEGQAVLSRLQRSGNAGMEIA